ncbi:bifunctional pyr operon transcriptional regulator/uracil phosphoribosyltransferase PyrR [Candidatus Mycalebacterium sp.]
MMIRHGGKILETVMDSQALNGAVEETARRIAKDSARGGFCVVGIKTMGEVVARQMARFLSALTGKPAPLGVLDITLYRDDIGRGNLPQACANEMPFSVDAMDVVIVDDVISTGRTARAAIESVMDYGRPSRIRLAVIADRGNREFPIQPDYCSVKVNPGKKHRVTVMIGGKKPDEDGVFICENKEARKRAK